jgi:hypothetical protein
VRSIERKKLEEKWTLNRYFQISNSEARKYLQNKDLKDVILDIEKNRENTFNEKAERRKKLGNTERFLKDIKEMKKKDIDYKYGMSRKATTRRIRRMLGHRGVKNYTQARDYLKDKKLKDVLRDIDGQRESESEQDTKKERYSESEKESKRGINPQKGGAN